MTYTRKNTNVCSSCTTVCLTPEGAIESVEVKGGCNGNLKAVCALLAGKKAEEAAAMLKNIRCEDKKSSCPAQIALCLEEALGKH